MAYGYVEEVRADAASARMRLNETSGTSAADAVGGSSGTYRGRFTLGVAGLLASDADKAVTLFGDTGLVTFADRAEFDLADTFTLEAWISPTAYVDGGGFPGAIMDKGTGAYIVRFADARDGRFILRCNGTATLVTSTMPVPLNQPSHIVITKSGATVKLYLNGADVTGTVTNTTMTDNANPFVIGSADGGANNFFAGTIDEVAVYRTALSAHRVLAHYKAAMGLPLTSARPIIVLDQVFASSARTTLTVNRPAGSKVGDIIGVAVKLHSTSVTVSGGSDWTIPTGGRQTNTTTSKNHQLVFLWHRVRADDPASWTLAWDGTSLTTAGWARVYRGAPATGDPIDVCAGAALAAAGSGLPFASPNASGAGLGMIVWCSFGANGFPQQPGDWFYGAGAPTGAAVGSFEKLIGGRGMLPTPSPLAGTSDAWTTLELVIKDGGVQLPAVNLSIGLDGVNSPNDRGNPGWTDGYTPALSIGSNFVRVDCGPGMSQADSDAEFADAARRGMRVLPLIWSNQQISTINFATFTAYVAGFVSRYGPGGTFWSGRTDAYLAPEYIELFNEPYGTWFVGTVEPSSYADIYIQSVRAGRAANPRCKYLIAGTDRYFQGSWQAWFSAMFSAQPTLGNFIDGVTAHLYGTHPLDIAWWGNYGEWPMIESIAPDLFSRGVDIGGAVRFWITEWGFTTTARTTSPDYGVSEADQASQCLDALRIFYGRWADLIAAWMLYRYRDGVSDTRENRWGIVSSGGVDKPAKTALAANVSAYLGSFVHTFGPDQWLPGLVWTYDGAAWAQAPGVVVAG